LTAEEKEAKALARKAHREERMKARLAKLANETELPKTSIYETERPFRRAKRTGFKSRRSTSRPRNNSRTRVKRVLKDRKVRSERKSHRVHSNSNRYRKEKHLKKTFEFVTIQKEKTSIVIDIELPKRTKREVMKLAEKFAAKLERKMKKFEKRGHF
jgi:hypothetical protein